MAIMNRVGRLFRADVHAALDQLEEPDLLLKQAIREMEETLAHSAQQLQAREHEQRDLGQRREEIQRGLASVAGELDLCFAAGNEGLQRMLLRRRLEGERLIAQIGQRADGVTATTQALRKQIDEQRRRLESMRERAAVFDRDATSAINRAWSGESVTVSDADVELALLRERALRGGS